MQMKLSERHKHQVVGVIVIVALLVVFLPAIVKTSNERLEESATIAMRLPEKPRLPKVDVKHTPQRFQETLPAAIAHQDIPDESVLAQIPQDVKAERIAVVRERQVTKVQVAQTKPGTITQQKLEKRLVPVRDAKKDSYTVQLATFSSKQNAEALVLRLKKKGYYASYAKFSNKEAVLYKVTVGSLTQKQEAHLLQRQLAELTKLNGVVVLSEVS